MEGVGEGSEMERQNILYVQMFGSFRMRFGKLTAIEPDGQVIRGSTVWLCRCGCGDVVHAPLHQLIAGYLETEV